MTHSIHAMQQTPSQQIELALHYYQQGNSAEAEELCRILLKKQRNNPAALQLLGIIATTKGATREAINVLQLAAQLVPRDPAVANSLANAYLDANDLKAAEKYYRKTIQLDAAYGLAYYGLATVLSRQDSNNFEEAITYFEQSIALRPDLDKAYEALAKLYLSIGETQQALRYAQQALHRMPNSSTLLVTIGNIYWKRDEYSKAESSYTQAITLDPGNLSAYQQQTRLLTHERQYEKGHKCIAQAIRLVPDSLELYACKGYVHERAGEFQHAQEAYRHCIALQPRVAQAHYDLARLSVRQADIKQGEQDLRAALSLSQDTGALVRGVVAYLEEFLHEPMLLQQALDLLTRMVEQAPGKTETLFLEVGWVLNHLDLVAQAILFWQRTRQSIAHSAALFAMHYLPDYTPAQIYTAHRRFDEGFAKPLAVKLKPHKNSKIADKPLRIGYISRDFRKHAVAYFLEPILASHNPEEFEVFCYSNSDRHDDVSKRLKTYARGGWRHCHDWTDTLLAQNIRNDKIDILIDLMGHTGNNRILAFARKPAPIQMTYLGYPDSTGLNAIDYRLTDAYVEPKGDADGFSSEKLIRLPNTYFCYRPSDEAADTPTNVPPCLENGYITFGSFNLPRKISDVTIQLWKQILDRLPDAKLFLKLRSPSYISKKFEDYLKSRFTAHGISRERLIIADYARSMKTYMQMYHQVDICLDSYPYNGATTTCESLWMGLPVISLSGQNHISRMAGSILSAVGLPELAVSNAEAYIETAVRLAQDPAHLSQLRSTLRDLMRASPLMDEQGFTRQLEARYRQVWRDYCGAPNH